MKSKLLTLTVLTLLSTVGFAKGGSDIGSGALKPTSKVSLKQMQNEHYSEMLTNTIVFEGQIANTIYMELMNGSGIALPGGKDSSAVEAKDLTLSCSSKNGTNVKCEIKLRSVSKEFPDAAG